MSVHAYDSQHLLHLGDARPSLSRTSVLVGVRGISHTGFLTELTLAGKPAQAAKRVAAVGGGRPKKPSYARSQHRAEMAGVVPGESIDVSLPVSEVSDAVVENLAQRSCRLGGRRKIGRPMSPKDLDFQVR